MRIVVATGFSANAKIAARFALALARRVKAEVILLYVLPNLGPTFGVSPTSFIKQELLIYPGSFAQRCHRQQPDLRLFCPDHDRHCHCWADVSQRQKRFFLAWDTLLIGAVYIGNLILLYY